ncbi:hypothetical protein BN871_FZ_00070 [Paenibacillus sp. P22]|nr:hypothetical protein BN871_FZ_00070 [Paenibacillus sp. P22]
MDREVAGRLGPVGGQRRNQSGCDAGRKHDAGDAKMRPLESDRHGDGYAGADIAGQDGRQAIGSGDAEGAAEQHDDGGFQQYDGHYMAAAGADRAQDGHAAAALHRRAVQGEADCEACHAEDDVSDAAQSLLAAAQHVEQLGQRLARQHGLGFFSGVRLLVQLHQPDVALGLDEDGRHSAGSFILVGHSRTRRRRSLGRSRRLLSSVGRSAFLFMPMLMADPVAVHADVDALVGRSRYRLQNADHLIGMLSMLLRLGGGGDSMLGDEAVPDLEPFAGGDLRSDHRLEGTAEQPPVAKAEVRRIGRAALEVEEAGACPDDPESPVLVSESERNGGLHFVISGQLLIVGMAEVVQRAVHQKYGIEHELVGASLGADEEAERLACPLDAAAHAPGEDQNRQRDGDSDKDDGGRQGGLDFAGHQIADSHAQQGHG